MSELTELLKCESWDLYHEELIISTEGCSCSQLLESDLLVGVAVPTYQECPSLPGGFPHWASYKEERGLGHTATVLVSGGTTDCFISPKRANGHLSGVHRPPCCQHLHITNIKAHDSPLATEI